MNKLYKKINKVCDDIEFAGIVTLTRLAKKSQYKIQSELPEKFTIRTPWTIKGIRITPATKKTKESEVFSKDWYMPSHELGKDRRARSGYFLIPVHLREYLGIPENKLIPRKYKSPASLLKQNFGGKKPFMHDNGIYIEDHDKKAELLLYFYPKKIEIKKNKWFFDTIDKVYDEEFERTWQQAMLEGFTKNF